MNLTVHDVARQAGVSPATVSRTFRQPEKLRLSTRRRVLEVASRLNYQPRERRAGAAEGAAPTAEALGFLYFAADASETQLDNFYAPVMMGAQSEAGRAGVHLILRTASRYERPRELPQMFREQAVTGILLVGAALPDVLATYESSGPPAILVDNRDAEGRSDCILSDGFGGTLHATRYLIGLGHRRIAFVTHETTAPSIQDRRHGFLCALWEAGITVDPSWLVSTPGAGVTLEPYLMPLLAAPGGPTAVVAANDLVALGVLVGCRRLGLAVPQDVSVVGFDDTAFSVHAYPPLTTVQVDKEHLGRLAVRQLLARIAEARRGGPALPASHLVVPVSLVERESCAPPP